MNQNMHRENPFAIGAIVGSWIGSYFDKVSDTQMIVTTIAGIGFILFKQIELLLNKQKQLEARIDFISSRTTSHSD